MYCQIGLSKTLMKTIEELTFDILSYLDNRELCYEEIQKGLQEPNKLYSSREYLDKIDKVLEQLIDDEYIEEDIYTHSTHIVDHDNTLYYYSLTDTGKDFLKNLRVVNESTSKKV